MPDDGIGDYFISDLEEDVLEEEDELVPSPIVVPIAPATQQAPVAATAPPPAPEQRPPAVRTPAAGTTPAPQAPGAVSPQAAAPRPQAQARPLSREERLAQALDGLIASSPDIQAAALVSMDGFTMAAALPEGMHEDRVGAMSAAILGLGERAAAELGRGHLSQVFIEGDSGYVLLIAAGDRAVLTALASPEAKLGLIIYDMRDVARAVSEILG